MHNWIENDDRKNNALPRNEMKDTAMVSRNQDNQSVTSDDVRKEKREPQKSILRQLIIFHPKMNKFPYKMF